MATKPPTRSVRSSFSVPKKSMSSQQRNPSIDETQKTTTDAGRNGAKMSTVRKRDACPSSAGCFMLLEVYGSEKQGIQANRQNTAEFDGLW